MDNTFNLLKALCTALGFEIEKVEQTIKSQERINGEIITVDSAIDVDYLLKKKPKERKSKEVTYSPEFEEAWKIYPKKSGNKKAAAYEQWRARIEHHATCEYGACESQMLEGTKRYAAYCKATNKPEQYVYQGSTFFGRERLYLDEWNIPKEATKIKLPRNDDDLASFAQLKGLSQPPRGMGFIEYRRLLESEIERRS